MPNYRLENHPILAIPDLEPIQFTWQRQPYAGRAGETISSALFANGIRTFGHHHRDGSPQGIFCANGQCAQCLVLANGKPVKACMELLTPGVCLEPVEGVPELPQVDQLPELAPIEALDVQVLIIGGGPAGLSAAIELGKAGIQTLLVDDKHRLGGKLVLQTHRFFGSVEAVYAGTRGIDIATLLEAEIQKYPSVQIWLNSTALAVFSDKKVGILHGGDRYVLVAPQALLVAAGAREKTLAFGGNTLPGVYGAGAFQTLVNRDQVRPAQRLFIVGGGNVGLIAGYHALQAGIEVVGLVEALPECGGYKVHKDKLARLGVPIFTSHTILSANGTREVESATIAAVDEHFRPVPGSERTFPCDTILVAVGLDPINEFTQKAVEFGLPCFAAGDADEIAEASAAIFSGKIRGREMAQSLGVPVEAVPAEWRSLAEILKSKPGEATPPAPPILAEHVTAILHCTQEIPCNPCATICPKGLIAIDPSDLRKTPRLVKGDSECGSCERCVAICPGLAITLVDRRKNPDLPIVSIPFEFDTTAIHKDDSIPVVDTEGAAIGEVKVLDVLAPKFAGRTKIIRALAPLAIAGQIAGVRIQEKNGSELVEDPPTSGEAILCRCERVSVDTVRSLVREGYRDINEIRAVTRAGMGACRSKTCGALIRRVFQEEGVPKTEIVEESKRPLFIEVPLGVFAGEGESQGGRK